MPERSPTEPTFTDTMQIGIVVPDLDAAIRTYRDVYGIGPWEVFEVGPENTERDLGVILEIFGGMPKKQTDAR
jgi:hypothetical protein